MDIKKIPIKKLIPAGYNPRKNLIEEDKEYQKIKNSIIKFGYVEPIIVNKNFTVIGGHQRLKVLDDLNYKDVECVIVDLTEIEEKALNVALNKISGEWDMDKLKDILNEINLDFNIELTGFDKDEFEELTRNLDIDAILDSDKKDKSDSLKEKFEIVIECENDMEQEGIFLKLSKEGYKCRVLTL